MQQRYLFILVSVLLIGAFMVGVSNQTTTAIEVNGNEEVEASAACDGDDLVITWTGPDYYVYAVSWEEPIAASPPNGALLADVPSGYDGDVTSPHRLTGPGTWLGVALSYELVMRTAPTLERSEPSGRGRIGQVELGDFTCPEPGPEPVYGCTFDGRLNDDFCGYPIAVYRTADGYSIYAIDPDTAEGTLVFEVMSASGEAQLLAEGVHSFTNQPIEVYLLANGDIQINTFYADGKPYIFVISSSGNYHLAR